MTPDERWGYADALAALQERGRFGIRLGLGRTRALLRALGDPERTFPGVLIAGTNGKGSVQALVASCLRLAGLRVGQTPKPHLVTYRERIVVDGELIGPDDFAALVREVVGHADRIARRLGPATEFELVTAAAFAWFARRGIDVGVVEVGLGGRLDATNAWDGGVAAVTNVELDHMDRLGSTRTAIGREKAAIIKRGDVAVTGAMGEGLAVIRRRAKRLSVPLLEAVPLPVLGMDRAGLRLAHPRLGTLSVGLLGRHQAENAGVALGILDALARQGIASVTDIQVGDGLADTRWPGRLELLAGREPGTFRSAGRAGPDPAAPDVLLDGAHNVHGAAALAAALDELRPSLSPGRPTLLMGVVTDKDVEGMVAALAAGETVRSARIVATGVPGTPRALDAEELAAAWRSHQDARAAVESIADADAGLALALEHGRRENGPVIVAGSLYLVGHVRGRLVDDPALQDPEA